MRLQDCFTFISSAFVTFYSRKFKAVATASAVLAVSLGLSASCYALPASPVATQISLAITSGGNATVSIDGGDIATLTATVLAGSSSVPSGTVNFCDASAVYCTDVHILGTAQITSSGTAVLRLTPAAGSHSYKAIFAGTNAYASSVSTSTPLTVTGLRSSTTTLTSTLSAGKYSLAANVTARGSAPLASTGSVSFTDVSNSGTLLGSATLATVTSAFSLVSGTTPNVTGTAVAVGDFNGDGHADILTINSAAAMTVSLGNGDGTFSALPSFSPIAYTYIMKIDVADFNSDGKKDLAIIGNENNVTILLGNGDGTFSVSGTTATGTRPTDIATADWNGDGSLDLAISNNNSSNVTILLGNGDGTFTPAANVSTSAGPGSIALGDFNGDGKPDLAVLTLTDYVVSTFFGAGDGTFGPATKVMTGFNVSSIATADFNADGTTDIAVGMGVTSSIYFYLGKGDGTFGAPSSVAAGSLPSHLTIADFNGDGIADVGTVSSNSNSTAGPTILLGKADGTFASVGSNGTYSNTLAAGDFNGDGYADLIYILRYSGDAAPAILLSGPTNTATATLTPVSLGVGTHQITAGYAADTNYAASTSSPLTLIVPKLTTTLSLSATPSNSVYGSQVVLTATLSPYTTQSQSSDGESITFRSGTAVLGTGVLSLGVATLNVTGLTVSANSLTASFAGDTYLSAATSAALSFSVTKATPLITWLAPDPITYGTAISAALLNATSSVPGTFSYSPVPPFVPGVGIRTLSASFTPTDSQNYAFVVTTNSLTVNKAPLTLSVPSASRPYGSANPTFSVSSSGIVNNDVLTISAFSPAQLSSAPGTYPIFTTILGSAAANYTISSPNGTLTVTKAPTTSVLTTSSGSAQVGSTITFTATVAPGTSGTPTGSISFSNGAALLAAVPLVGNTATYATNTLAIGSYTISAAYGGDTNFIPSTATASQVVLAAPDFSVTTSSTTATVKQGQSATLTVTAVPSNNFNQQLALSCTGLPALTTCTFSPATLTPNGAPATSQLTITTTAPTSASLQDVDRKHTPWKRGEEAAVLTAALLCVLPAGARRSTRKAAGIFLFLVALVVMPLTGCSSSPAASNSGSTGTPSGSSQVTIVAATSSSTQKLATITLTVTN